jgi:rhomboid protease GluP
MSLLHWSPVFSFSDKLVASYQTVVEQGELWRLFTTTFVHADLNHLLSNSLMLSLLVYFVSSFFGSFISIGLSFIVAMLTNYFVIDMNSVSLVGASGVVYYLWGFWMILYIFIQRHLSIIQRVLRMGTVFLVLLVPTQFQPSTSYLAHYTGFAFGVIAGGMYYFIFKDKLHSAEVWSIREVSDELTELDELALSYPIEDS